MSKKNTYKPKQETKASKRKKQGFNHRSLGLFFKNRRLKKAFGLFLIIFSFFLFLAFLSYLFTWKEYDHLVDNQTINWKLLTDSSITVNNMMGRLGAVAGHLFIKMGFGISSFLFLLLFFTFGLGLLADYKLFSYKKLSLYSAFFILWISLFFGFINTSAGFSNILGGSIGVHSVIWLNGLAGSAGTALMLIFSLGVVMIIAFDPNFNAIVAFFNKIIISIKTNTRNKKDVFKEPHNQVYKDQDEAISTETETETETDKNQQEPFVDSINGNESVNVNNEKIDENGAIILTTDSEPEFAERPDKDHELEIEVGSEKVTGSNYQTIDKPFSTSNDDLPDLSHLGEYDPTLDLPHYRFPELRLLDDRGSGSIQINKEELENNKNRIIETLKNYTIEIDKIKATVGPTVTLYEIVPAPGIRISKIKNLENDIALSLSALGIRIIAPIPGRGTIGIEVPNSNPEIVSMRSVLGSERFRNSSYELPIGLGKTIANETFIADLTKMPHLLMAGATGQGKSVGLNAILTSILYKKHPAFVKFVLIDPKKVELNLFSKIERHFLAKLPDAEEAIVTETREVIRTINSLCVEMDNRYDLLKDAQARNIKEYNAKFVTRRLNPNHGHRFLPYIVLFIDEFADLIMTAGKEVELPIARLAQLARAVGIHLVIATQRPSVNIITGTIKANFPARIAFRVTAKVDSRTILDGSGADQLIGRGDMLLSTGSDLLRLQCAFIDTPEIERITEFIGSQKAYPDAFYLPEYLEDESSVADTVDPSERDELFDEAARIVVATQQGSTSLIQRKLKLGYNRAGRIIDQLESAGIVGPFEGSKARDVMIKDEVSLEQFLRKET